MARRPKKKSGRSVDFSQEVKYFEPDMEYELEVKSAIWEDGSEHPYIAIEFTGVDENEGSTLYHNASASPKSLHRLRNLLEALGFEVPEGEMDIDTDELVGLRCMAHTFEDRYKGNDGETKTSVKADDFWPVEEKSSKKGGKKKDEEDDEPKGKRGGKKSKLEPIAKDEVPDDRDELDELVEKYSLDIEMTRKLKKDDEAYQEAVIEALEEAGMIAEEEKSSKRGKRGAKDEDDEPKGKAGRSSRGSGKSKDKSWKEDDIADMSEEDLEEVVEQAKLKIDLDEHRTLRKKKNAVIDALEEAGKLAD